MEKEKKKSLFIRQPEYPGGPKAFSKFIQDNLLYPASALESGTEGTVMVEYDIDYQGKVVATRVLQSLAPAFDEEACRVLRLLKFDVPKNRGVKVLFHKKAHIHFKKPAQKPFHTSSMQVNYSITPAPTPAAELEEKPERTYSYTIQF